jgi:PAS domain S-box-containing protein
MPPISNPIVSNISQEKLNNFRLKAEKILDRQLPSDLTPRSSEELLHELQVHQIELEMQNDELRRAQIIIEESRDRYLDLYDFAPIGYLTLNRDGEILETNLTCASLLGIERNKLINQRFVSWVKSEHKDHWYQHFLRTRQSGGKHSCELQLKRGDGSFLYAKLASIQTKAANDAPVRVILTDITEQIQMEREVQERRNEMAELHTLHVASQTAASIAHELNQPLLSIASYSKAALMLMNTDKPDLNKIRRAMQGCERQSLRAGSTMRELIELLSSGEFTVETLDLNKELNSVMRTAIVEHELDFDPVLLEGDGTPLVRASRTHFHKVMLNLLHNAVEAMKEARVELPVITVTVAAKPDESVAQVTIQDNGPGIKQDELQRLFDPFFTTKDKGIGMGLAVSRSLIEENGGHLWVDPQDCNQLWYDPQERYGATFHLTLPFAS